MDTKDAPQIIEHLGKSIAFTPFETRWIPASARFVLLGQTPKAKGIMQVYQLDENELSLVKEKEDGPGFKCATFGASTITQRHMATGDYDGYLKIWDLETMQPTFSVKGHSQIINSIDGCGGLLGQGAPEIVTGSRDGCVRVWDPRQQDPVLSLEPVEAEVVPDCWAVRFGNAYSPEERTLVAGYDNGDVKLFDLRTSSLKWDTNLKNGVCGLEFDRKDTLMNKLVVTTLESKFHVFDMRTFNVDSGYTGLVESAHKSTIWGVSHAPQNRDLFATLGGNGAVNLYKYSYPEKRVIDDLNNNPIGVVGNVKILNEKELAQQPIISWDWNPDKLGLAVMCALDQSVKVVIVTRLGTF